MSDIQVTPDRLRDIKRECVTQAGNAQDILTRVEGSIEGSGWKSPAATRFREDWDNKFRPALTELKAALENLGQAADTMAQNYDSTEQSYRGG